MPLLLCVSVWLGVQVDCAAGNVQLLLVVALVVLLAGNPAWKIQCWVSGLTLTYLCFIVALQMINLGSYLPWMHNTIVS